MGIAVDPKGQHLDLSSEPPGNPSGGGSAPSPEQGKASRPFLGVRFACCDVYLRVYVNQTGDAYEARCPRCAKPVRFKVGAGGTDARFFEVG